MVINDALLKKLRSAFSLNIYEVKVWTALLSKGTATAGELSDMSNVPRSRSYDVLESLEKKGFIIMKLGRPIKYLAVSPNEIVKRVKKGIEEKAQEEVKAVDSIQDTDIFSELSLLFKQGITHVDPTNISGSFKGRNNIYEHVNNLISNAQNEIIIVTSNEGLSRKLEYMKGALKKANNNKVKIKIGTPLKTDRAKELAKEFSQFAEVKDIDLNSRFVLVDNKDVVFMLNSDKDLHESADVGVWVNTPFFGQSLKVMLEAVWK